MKPGSVLDPHKPAIDWIRETYRQRVVLCRKMLHLHGFVSDAEDKKIQSRIDAWLKRVDEERYGEKP